MAEDIETRLEGIDAESGAVDDEDAELIRAALTSEKSLERSHGARVCDQIAEADVAAVRPFVDDLTALLEDDNPTVAQNAAKVLLRVAYESPGDLTDSVPEVVSLTERDVNSVELTGAQILGQVVLEHPESCAPEVDRLAGVLEGRSAAFEGSGAADMVDDRDSRQSIVEHEKEEHQMRLQTQRHLSNVLVAIAESEPSALSDDVEDVLALFDAPDATIVGAGVDAVAELAKDDPDAAAPAFDGLIACLSHDDPRVRARAIRGLGYLGDDDAVGPLRDLADADPDDDVAELAADTAEFLAEE